MGTQSKTLRFKAVRQEIPVEIEDSSGNVKKYTLREFDGASRDAYMNQIREKANIDAEGNIVGWKTFEGIQSGLLALCLYDEKNKVVPEEVIQAFPTSVVDGLFREAQALNKLIVSEAARDEVKNV